MTELRKFNHPRWDIALFVVVLGVVVIISDIMLTSLASSLPASTPAITCPPSCGASPWLWQHPIYFFGMMGVIAVAAFIVVMLAFMFPKTFHRWTREAKRT